MEPLVLMGRCEMGYTMVAASNSTPPLNAVLFPRLIGLAVQLIARCHRVLVWPWRDREGRLVNGLTPLGDSRHQTLWRLHRVTSYAPIVLNPQLLLMYRHSTRTLALKSLAISSYIARCLVRYGMYT